MCMNMSVVRWVGVCRWVRNQTASKSGRSGGRVCGMEEQLTSTHDSHNPLTKDGPLCLTKDGPLCLTKDGPLCLSLLSPAIHNAGCDGVSPLLYSLASTHPTPAITFRHLIQCIRLFSLPSGWCSRVRSRSVREQVDFSGYQVSPVCLRVFEVVMRT